MRLKFLPLLAVLGLPAMFGAEHAVSVSPEQALKVLMDGNARYTGQKCVHPDQTANRRHDLAGGQHPIAVVLGCADSRVPPELIFDQGLGSLFVIRVAGNVASAEVLGSIEYAVEHLGVSLVMVLGHEKCGAVKATADREGGDVHVASLVKAIAPAVAEARRSSGDLVHNAVACNVRNTVKAVGSATPVLRKLVLSKKLMVVGADYDLETGSVSLIH